MKKINISLRLCAVTIFMSCCFSMRAATIASYEYETSGGAGVAIGESACGEMVDDSSTNALHGTGSGSSLQYSADVPYMVLGSDGQVSTRSLLLNADSADCVDLGIPPALTNLPQGAFTIQTWIKTTTDTRVTIAGAYDGDLEDTLTFELTEKPEIRFVIKNGSGATHTTAGSVDARLNDGEWHHVAAQYTGIDEDYNIRYYIDGKWNGGYRYSEGSYSVDCRWLLGADARSDVGLTPLYFDGLLDNTVFSDEVIDPTDFLIAGSGEQNYYRMETTGGVAVVSGQSADLVDDTGLHPFTYNGMGTSHAPVYSNAVAEARVVRNDIRIANEHSLCFDGTDDYVELSNENLLRGLPKGDFTIECFIKCPALTKRGVILGTYDGTLQYVLNFEIDESNGHLKVYMRGGGAADSFRGTVYVTDNEWHHVALVREGTLARLYVDYEQDIQQTLTCGEFMTGSSQFRIGHDTSDRYYKGLLDELRISRGALDVSDFLRQAPLPGTVIMIM